MTFANVMPNENFDLFRFKSGPAGLWQVGIIKMGFGKARVRMALTKSEGFVPIDYWGGDHDSSVLLLGFLMGLSSHLPETITETELLAILPAQNDKELGADFWKRLFQASDKARQIYGDRP
jgi:hypothetical protein